MIRLNIFSLPFEISFAMDFTWLLGLFLCVFISEDLVSAEYAKKSDVQFNLGNKRGVLARSLPAVKFYLYTRETFTNPEVLKGTFISIEAFPSLKNNKPIKVIIHGWLGSNEQHFSKTFREGLLENGDFNVIVVDWSEGGSKNWLYPMARNKVPQVATVVAQFLDNLNRRLGVRPERIHILGHSLGAHIAGIAGYLLRTGRIGRITGLDPAGPSFSLDKPGERLSMYSAHFVDVIHTCGKYLGMDEPIGHVDFYPNGGHYRQPGCGMDMQGSCSHRRAYFLYLESLENKRAFPALSCPSWEGFEYDRQSCDLRGVVYLGEGLPTSTRGVYYLRTNQNFPFGWGRV